MDGQGYAAAFQQQLESLARGFDSASTAGGRAGQHPFHYHHQQQQHTHTQQQQQQQQLNMHQQRRRQAIPNSNNPCATMYNPSMSSNMQQQQQAHHHHQQQPQQHAAYNNNHQVHPSHHPQHRRNNSAGIFMTTIGAYGYSGQPTAMVTTASPLDYTLQMPSTLTTATTTFTNDLLHQANQPQHAALSPTRQSTAPALSPYLEPLPLQQQQPTRRGHYRSSSLEDFVLLNQSLLSASPSFEPLPLSSAAVPDLSTSTMPQKPSEPEEPAWLQDFTMPVAGLSLEDMSGSSVFRRVIDRTAEVMSRYIPCVDFLVQCQQELRKGVAHAQKRRGRRYVMTPTNFYQVYVQNLPQRFRSKNQYTMDPQALSDAVQGLVTLTDDARKAERHGCEAVKNQFLGGMKDGESWGLRKWLSRNGNALRICTDIECIVQAVRKLDKQKETTRKLAALLRPLAKNALDRLRADIPPSYQAHSSAHPYLPFFHRLESALRSLSTYDPEEDDVIVLDDSDSDDEVEVCSPRRPPIKRPPRKKMRVEEINEVDVDVEVDKNVQETEDPATDDPSPTAAARQSDDNSSSGESDAGVIEIVGVKEMDGLAGETHLDEAWQCTNCHSYMPGSCSNCGGTSVGASQSVFDGSETGPQWPFPLTNEQELQTQANAMADNIDRVAVLFEQKKQITVRPMTAPVGKFWDADRYAKALRLFSDILRSPDSLCFLDSVNDDQCIEQGLSPFTHVVKHPLCFRSIVRAVVDVSTTEDSLRGGNGRLPLIGLHAWNMWKGMDLLQAIDLAFLNSLAYGRVIGVGKSKHRSQTNKLRKTFWQGIEQIINEEVGNDSGRKKMVTPTRRSETSGFVVYKIQER